MPKIMRGESGLRRGWERLITGMKFLLGSDENVLELDGDHCTPCKSQNHALLNIKKKL